MKTLPRKSYLLFSLFLVMQTHRKSHADTVSIQDRQHTMCYYRCSMSFLRLSPHRYIYLRRINLHWVIHVCVPVWRLKRTKSTGYWGVFASSSFLITEQSSLYDNNHYHEECLRCNSCGINLSGPSQVIYFTVFSLLLILCRLPFISSHRLRLIFFLHPLWVSNFQTKEELERIFVYDLYVLYNLVHTTWRFPHTPSSSGLLLFFTFTFTYILCL